MKKTLTFLLILSSIIGFSQTKPTDPGFKSLITPRAVTFWWDAANSDPWMQSSYLGTAPNTWVKLWTATKIQVKLDSLANAKQDTLTLTTTGTGAATLIGSTLNIPIASGIVPDSLKEDKVNKENTTVDNDTIKYPTVNLLKTYADTKAPLTLFDVLTSGYIPRWNGTEFVNSHLQYNGVNSLYIGGIYSATGGMVRLRDVYATGSNQTFMGIEFNSSPGFDWTIGKYSNNTSGLFQIRDQSGNIALSINESHQITFPQLTSTNARLLSSSSTGQLTPIPDGTNGQVLQTNGSGGYSFVNQSAINPAVQILTGTTPSWNNGSNAKITLTGNTTITLSNLRVGYGGRLSVINPATSYDITFSGAYTINIDRSVWKAGDTVYTSGGSLPDSYYWYYNGDYVEIGGTLGQK